jgi:hypothetical protein
MTFQGTLGWLDEELAKLEEKAAKLRAAREVLAEYAAPAAPVVRPKPQSAKAERVVVLTHPRHGKTEAVRRKLIAAAASKVQSKLAAPKLRKDGKPMPGVGDWKCKACGGRGHSARSKSCPKKSAEPAPADFVERVLAAAPAPVVAALAPPALKSTRGAPIKGKSAAQRVCRCTVLVESEYGSGGRGIKKQHPCGATVWANDRQRHLHAEHGVIDPALDNYFEALADPEEDADADAA